MDFLNYQSTHKTDNKYALVILSMDGFSQVKTYLEEDDITLYLNEIGKVIKMYLKKGWKFCQSKERDAFLIYLPIIEDIEFKEVLEKMYTALKLKKINLIDIDIQRNFSLAHVTFPEQAETIQDLLNRLYATLLMIKKKGGNQAATFESFNYEDQNNYHKYLSVKDKIIENHFGFKYVPLRDKLGQILGLELNLYNQLEDKIEIYDEFIATLETTNDAFWFSNWLFEKAIEETFELLSTFETRSFMILLPCSIQQLMHEDIINTLSNIVNKYKINAKRVVLNLKHTNTNFEGYHLLQNLNALKKKGFLLSTRLNDKMIESLKYQYPLDFIEVNSENIDSKKHELNNEYQHVKKIVRHINLEAFDTLDIHNTYLIKDLKENSFKVKSLMTLVNESLDK